MSVIELDAKETAKMVRDTLKDLWPKVKFSVTTSWGKIDVKWEDGPNSNEVDYALSMYVGIQKDEWGASKNVNTYIGGKTYHFKVQYLFTSRSLSKKYLEAVRDYAVKRYVVEPEGATIEVLKEEKYLAPRIANTDAKIAGQYAEDFIYKLARDYGADIFMKPIKSPAKRFRQYADTMQKEIDNKRRPRLTNTRKRRDEADSAKREALKLEKIQDRLRALADRWDDDNVPLCLSQVSTKAQVEYLVTRRGDAWMPRADSDDYKMLVNACIGDSRHLYGEAITEMHLIGNPEAGEMTQQDKIDAKKIEILSRGKIDGFFPTPDSVIDKLLARASIQSGNRVLEPSAGWGNIADRIRDEHPDAVLEVIEISYSLREMLTLKGHKLVAYDCTEYEPEELYDVIVMNPPFENGQDAQHIQHCYEHFLKPGGRLVSVCSAGLEYRQDAQSFREWLDEVGYMENLPDGAFMENKEITTGVSTRMVVIDKPGGAVADNTPVQATEAAPVQHTTYPEFEGKRLYNPRHGYGWYSHSIPLGMIVVEEEPCGYQVVWDGRDTEIADVQRLDHQPVYYEGLSPVLGDYVYHVEFKRLGRVVASDQIKKLKCATDQGSLEQWDEDKLRVYRNQEEAGLLLSHVDAKLLRIRTLKVLGEELREAQKKVEEASLKTNTHLDKLYTVPKVNVWDLVKDEIDLLDDEEVHLDLSERGQMAAQAHYLQKPFFYNQNITIHLPSGLCAKLLRRSPMHRGGINYGINIRNNTISYGDAVVWKTGGRAIAKAVLELATEDELSRVDWFEWKHFISKVKAYGWSLKEMREKRPKKYYRNGKEITFREAMAGQAEYYENLFGAQVGDRVEYDDQLWIVISYRIHPRAWVKIQPLAGGEPIKVKRSQVMAARPHCRECLTFDNLILDEDLPIGKHLCWDCLSKPIAKPDDSNDHSQLSLWD